MIVSELKNLARRYASSHDSQKKEIIRKIWQEEKRDGLELLAEFTGTTIPYLYWRGGIETLKKNRNRSRRGQKPLPAGRVDPAEVARLARRVAGGGRIAPTGGWWRGAGGGKRSLGEDQGWEAKRGGLLSRKEE